MRLAADARLLIAAERGVRRIGMVTVGPHPARLDCAPEPVAAVYVAAPNAGAQAVQRVVGYRQRLLVRLESRNGHDRAKDLLLEDPHLVVALEHGGLDVIAAGQSAGQLVAFATGQDLRTFLSADIEIAENFLELLARRLGANHR